jgi:hypothetical protein
VLTKNSLLRFPTLLPNTSTFYAKGLEAVVLETWVRELLALAKWIVCPHLTNTPNSIYLQNKKRESPADFIPRMKRFLQHTTRLLRSLVMCLTPSYGCAILRNRIHVLFGVSMRQKPTPSFILSLLLQVNSQQAAHLHAHFECARRLYNALLSEAMKRLTHMRADPAWQTARSIPRSDKRARSQAFARLRTQYGFSEYGLHEAANRVCVGEARRVRFRSKGRGLDSVEGKTNTSGLRFHLQSGADGNQGWLSWNGEQIPALIDRQDEVVHHGLQQRIKYVRLLRQRASSPRAQGADCRGFEYCVQLILEGHPLQRPKNMPGKGVVGLDLGPSTLAIVPQEGRRVCCCWPRNWLPMRACVGGCNAIWSGNAEPIIPSTTMKKAASGNAAEARGDACGRRATAISRPAGAWRRPSASWRRTGAACLANWPTRSSAWAMIYGLKRSATRAGNAALAEV